MSERFTQDELALAKTADLCDIAARLGYTVRRSGKYYTLKEMDSIRIYNRRSWFRWSREFDKGENGGSQIDFLRVFQGMEVKEAVFWLLDFIGYRRGMELPEIKKMVEPEKAKKPFALPERFWNAERITDYLVNVRCLRKETVDGFIKRGLVYEAKRYHNIVFVGRDKAGTAKIASLRGIYNEEKPFKCDVEGSNKEYGFNLPDPGSSVVYVFEGATDLMSFVDIFGFQCGNCISMAGVSDGPLHTFLKENENVREICFHLDNDKAGREASEALAEKYYALGYEVEVKGPPKGFKDYNQWLQHVRSTDEETRSGVGMIHQNAKMM